MGRQRWLTLWALAVTLAVTCVSVHRAWRGEADATHLNGFVLPGIAGAAVDRSAATRIAPFQPHATGHAAPASAFTASSLGVFASALLLLAAGRVGSARSKNSPRPRVVVYGTYRPAEEREREYDDDGNEIVDEEIVKRLKQMPHYMDMYKAVFRYYFKKFDKASDSEDLVRRRLYGSTQFQFQTSLMADRKAYFDPEDRSRGPRKTKREPALYKRKCLEPGRFKKLGLWKWEMPHNYAKSVSLEELVEAGFQYGHSTRKWSQKMFKYIYADFDGSHIFDLVQSAAQLNRACYYCQEAAKLGAKFLLVGTKLQANKLVKEHAEAIGEPFAAQRYGGGFLTNFNETNKERLKLKKLEIEYRQGAWSQCLPEHADLNYSDLIKKRKKYAGISNMADLPDIVIAVDEYACRFAKQDCKYLGIPFICLCDSNANLNDVDLPVPGNASSARSIDLFLRKIAEAIATGKKAYEAIPEGELAPYAPEYDPYLYSPERKRWYFHRSVKQPWHWNHYGGHQSYKKAHPKGKLPIVPQYDPDFDWETPKRQFNPLDREYLPDQGR